MDAHEITNYELLTKFFDGKMNVALPKEGVPESFAGAGWMLDGTSLLLAFNGKVERYIDVPGPMRMALDDLGVLYIIDLDRDRVLSANKKFTVFAQS